MRDPQSKKNETHQNHCHCSYAIKNTAITHLLILSNQTLEERVTRKKSSDANKRACNTEQTVMSRLVTLSLQTNPILVEKIINVLTKLEDCNSTSLCILELELDNYDESEYAPRPKRKRPNNYSSYNDKKENY